LTCTPPTTKKKERKEKANNKIKDQTECYCCYFRSYWWACSKCCNCCECCNG
jgi:hypothetical protein